MVQRRRVRLSQKDYKAAAEAYASAQAKAGKGEFGEKVAHKLGWAYFQSQDYGKAHDAFAAQLESYPQGPLAADAAIMAAESLFKQDKYEPALAGFEKGAGQKHDHSKRRWGNARSEPNARRRPKTVVPRVHRIGVVARRPIRGPVEKVGRIAGPVKAAAARIPDSPHRMEAIYEQGSAEQNLGHAAEALKIYENVADNAQTAVGARARFMMGEVLFDQGNHREAIRNYYKVIYGYGDAQSPAPYHVWQANATFEAARCFEVIKSIEQAKKLYNELLSRYPDSDKAAAAKKRLAAIAG